MTAPRILTALLLAVAIAGLAGCAATIECPPPVNSDTRSVFLLDHGRHSTLVVERADGSLVRFAYGDWRYYAEADTSVRSGLAALLWRTPAAFGRREYAPGPVSAAVVEAAVRVGIEAIHELPAAGDAVDALTARLEDLFADRTGHPLVNEAYDLEFVPHPRDYWFWYNSNHMVADWLRALGCDVRGPTLLSRWRVAPAS